MSPPCGFPEEEYRTRLARAQTMMAEADLAALLLTTEPEIRYFTGFLTRFWESPTRPWFLIIPATGMPIAVIPAIGQPLMSRTWITDIRTWHAPDLQDDGITLLAETLGETAPTGRIGTPSGMETHARMPLASLQTLTRTLPMIDDANITRRLRLIKSKAEIAKIRHACAIASRAFARVPDIAETGTPLAEVFRRFQILCLEEGADWVPYLAGAAAEDGYADVISPATKAPLAPGDILMLDTGLVWDGYFCDFDRNYTVGPAKQETQSAHARLIEATEAAFALAKPGNTTADLAYAIAKITGTTDAGRVGHGLGMQLTEWPSLIPADKTILAPGMVLTLEPGIEVAPGKTLVHEENIVILETGAEYLSTPAKAALTEFRT